MFKRRQVFAYDPLEKQSSDPNLHFQVGSTEQNLTKRKAQQHNMTSYKELVRKSAQFLDLVGLKKYPTKHNILSALSSDTDAQKHAEECANGAAVILTDRVYQLAKDVLNVRQSIGTEAEQKVLEGVDVNGFIDRLLEKRPLVFMGRNDHYKLRVKAPDSTLFPTGILGWLPPSSPPFDSVQDDTASLREYISYEEMAVSALLGVAVHSPFINDGNRYNRGRVGKKGSFYQDGVMVGLVGSRFERLDQMESRFMLVSPFSSPENGYGINGDSHKKIALQPWATFYNLDYFPSYDEVVEATNNKTKESESTIHGEYIPIWGGSFLNVSVYKERMKHSYLCLFAEANRRASLDPSHRTAYVHAVGLGLGVWSVSPNQNALIEEIVIDLLQSHSFPHLSDVDLSWIISEKVGESVTVTDSAGHDILLHHTKNSPASVYNSSEEIDENKKEKLLVVSYAWDGNSYPGNEYWEGSLQASGDPAAACFSFIPELQNPLVNPAVSSSSLQIFPL